MENQKGQRAMIPIWRFLFVGGWVFNGAMTGACLCFVLVFVCAATVGSPSDGGLALGILFGMMLLGATIGGVGGYLLSRKGSKKPPQELP